MQISDASNIARLNPNHIPQQLKVPQTSTPELKPQPHPGLGDAAKPQILSIPKAIPNLPPIAIASPQVTDTSPTFPPDGAQVAMSHQDPMQALLADWGKTDSPHDLDGDGTVGIKDMLALLKQLAENPAEKETDPLQALIDDWGKTDSPHDLNGDGTVGIQDMLQLLANLANDPEAIPDGLYDPRNQVPDDSAGDGQSQSDRLQGLLDAWGQSASKYDLNGDGTVGINDMLMLLQQLADEVTQAPAGDPTNSTPGTPEAQTRLHQLFEAWGTSDSEFDLDNDGTVGIRDMLLLLAQMHNREPEVDADSGSGQRRQLKETDRWRALATTSQLSAADLPARRPRSPQPRWASGPRSSTARRCSAACA